MNKRIAIGFLFLAAMILCTACGQPAPDSSMPPASSAVSVGPISSATQVSSDASSVSSELDPNAMEYIDYYCEHDVNADLSVLNGETVKQLATVSVRTYILTESGRLFGCGFNQFRSLAQGTSQPVLGLVEIKLPEKIKLICAGEQGAVAVGESNDIYFWGRCFDFTYGVLPYDGNEPVRVPFDKEVAAIDMRFRRVLILTADGEAYAFGENYNLTETDEEDQTINGYDWSLENFLVPQKLEIPEKVTQLAATIDSMFFLGASGKCYTAFSPINTNYPTKAIKGNPYIKQIDFSQPVQSIGSGDETLFLVTKDGEVYAAGNNITLNMGIGTKEQSKNINPAYSETWVLKAFERVPVPEKVIKVAKSAAVNRSCFLTENGKVYVAGENFLDWMLSGRPIPDKSSTYGETEYVSEPVVMQLPDPVTDLDGRGVTLWYRRMDGKIFVVGLNTYGNALGAVRPTPCDGPYIQREPVEVPLTFADDFTFQ